MDAVSDPLVETVVLMCGSQLGKTELLCNLVGYHIEQDPAPILMVQPTLTMAEAWSKDRLAPMLRDTPALRGKVKDARSRDSGNSILHKIFPGGHITMAGANSPASLASRPIRIVLADEVDRYPLSAGTEGDPVSLAQRRSATFWNRKTVLASTPTIKGASRIEAAWESSDQRRYWVPCPDCGAPQVLKWEQVRWESGRPETAVYHCEACGSAWSDARRWAAIRNGEWRAEAPFNGTAGFHLSEIYSSWTRLADMARAFLAAKDHPEQFKTWINTALGETWQERGEAPDWERLYERREQWRMGVVPHGGRLLTAGVDVQRDRIEVYVWAWGRGLESWLVDRRIIEGDTSRPDVWSKLDDVVADEWPSAAGPALRISRVAVDTGYATQEVYAWARQQRPGLVMPVKGTDRAAAALGTASAVDVTAGGKRIRRGIRVWPVGVSLLKSELYGWLRQAMPEDGQAYPRGYVHLPQDADAEICRQLVAEHLVTLRSGKREWQKLRERNEALDCRIYARAASIALGIDRWRERQWRELEESLGLVDPPDEAPLTTPAEIPPTAAPAGAFRRPVRRVVRSSYLTR